jgi:hypothetical protein
MDKITYELWEADDALPDGSFMNPRIVKLVTWPVRDGILTDSGQWKLPSGNVRWYRIKTGGIE